MCAGMGLHYLSRPNERGGLRQDQRDSLLVVKPGSHLLLLLLCVNKQSIHVTMEPLDGYT